MKKMTLILGMFAAVLLFGVQVDGTAQATEPAGYTEQKIAGYRWIYHTGKGDTLCDAVGRILKHYPIDQASACLADVALSTPGLKELDTGWEELDIKQYEQLFKRLKQPDSRLTLQTQVETPEQAWQFAREHARMYKQTITLFTRPLGGQFRDEPTPSVPQTLVKFVYSKTQQKRKECPAVKSQPLVETHYVTIDLTGPDPNIPRYETNAMERGIRLVTYQGKLHLMSRGSDGWAITFYRDFGSRGLVPFCEFQKKPIFRDQ